MKIQHQKLEVLKNGFPLGEFNSSFEVAEIFDLNQSAVCKVANDHWQTTKGFTIKKINYDHAKIKR